MPYTCKGLLLWFIFFQFACASAPVNEKKISQMLFTSLRLRRPAGNVVNPQAGPGGEDYKRKTPPQTYWDCEKPENFFKVLRRKEIMKCLNSITMPGETIFKLHRVAQPFYEIKESSSCLRDVLPRIPVPREIVFQAHEAEDLPVICYASRINIEADEILGAKTPLNTFELKVFLPLDEPLQTESELDRLLAAWVLTPFFKTETKSISGSIVPDSICRKCVGEKEFLNIHSPEVKDQDFWPESLFD